MQTEFGSWAGTIFLTLAYANNKYTAGRSGVHMCLLDTAQLKNTVALLPAFFACSRDGRGVVQKHFMEYIVHGIVCDEERKRAVYERLFDGLKEVGGPGIRAGIRMENWR